MPKKEVLICEKCHRVYSCQNKTGRDRKYCPSGYPFQHCKADCLASIENIGKREFVERGVCECCGG